MNLGDGQTLSPKGGLCLISSLLSLVEDIAIHIQKATNTEVYR